MTNTTFAVGGDIEVRRLGFGAMRITGPGIWGPPRDRAAARALLRRAVDLGVQLIDTADAYGPGVSEELTPPTHPSPSQSRSAHSAPCEAWERSGTSASPTSPRSSSPPPGPSPA